MVEFSRRYLGGAATFGGRWPQLNRRSVRRQESAIHPHDTLVSLGEVAAAFAGFSGIVAALGGRAPREWSATDRFRFGNLLALSIATTVLAFLPVVLALFPISPGTVWTSSSVLLMLSCAPFLAYIFRTARTINAAERNQLRQWMAAAWLFGLGGVALAQGIAIATAPESVDAAIYVAGTLVLLALAGLQFALHAFSAITKPG